MIEIYSFNILDAGISLENVAIRSLVRSHRSGITGDFGASYWISTALVVLEQKL